MLDLFTPTFILLEKSKQTGVLCNKENIRIQ